jgi:undecaprenyl-diphosphatase
VSHLTVEQRQLALRLKACGVPEVCLAFGGLTQDVAGHDDTVRADPHVTAWVIAHRTGWLTSALQVLTWLGSTAVIIPAGLAVGLYFLFRRRTWQPLALLAAAVAGAIGLYGIVKPLVGRPRPPAAIWIGHYTGAAFPSGHATQSAAFYAMLAIVLGAGLSARGRAILWSAAALVVLIVGASRIYLAAHWLTDVLAGYALGAFRRNLIGDPSWPPHHDRSRPGPFHPGRGRHHHRRTERRTGEGAENSIRAAQAA